LEKAVEPMQLLDPPAEPPGGNDFQLIFVLQISFDFLSPERITGK
jgi:hypothetical protein